MRPAKALERGSPGDAFDSTHRTTALLPAPPIGVMAAQDQLPSPAPLVVTNLLRPTMVSVTWRSAVPPLRLTGIARCTG